LSALVKLIPRPDIFDNSDKVFHRMSTVPDISPYVECPGYFALCQVFWVVHFLSTILDNSPYVNCHGYFTLCQLMLHLTSTFPDSSSTKSNAVSLVNYCRESASGIGFSILSGSQSMCDRGWVFEIWVRPKGVLAEPCFEIFTSREVSRAEKIALRGTDPVSYRIE